MDIKKYAGYFHDGALLDIVHLGNNIEISMLSAEMDPNDVGTKLTLATDNTIKGKLHIEGITLIKLDGSIFLNIFEKTYDDGDIYALDIFDNRVELNVRWINHPPKKYEETDIFTFEIDAKKIYWENIPNIAPPFW